MWKAKDLKHVLHAIMTFWDKAFSSRPKLDRDRWRFYNLLK